jgi:hypothetical protein
VATYTVITENRDAFRLSQHACETPETALAQHIGQLPFDDGAGPFDEELDWLQAVASGEAQITLLEVSSCRGTWMWLEGARSNPPYSTYLVRTELEPI